MMMWLHLGSLIGAFVGIIGLNFLVELGINVVLVPVVTRIIKAVA